MANTDITVTMAGLFQDAKLGRRGQLLLECLAGELIIGPKTTAPTTAQYNTSISAALQLMPPVRVGLSLNAIRVALLWQLNVVTSGSVGIISSTPNVNTLMSAAAYLQGLPDETLDILRTYYWGRAIGALG